MRLRSRAGNDVTARYPQLSSLAADLAEHRAVLDGEVVVFDENGIANFGLLQTGGISPDAQFLAFDVLYLDGTSLLRKKFADRRRVLEALAEITPSLQVPPLLDGDGQEALAASRERGLEGVVAKRRESVYLPGKRGQAWVKAKNWNTQEVVIGGWKRGQGGRRGQIGSLLVGIPDDDGSLRYVGKVGTGFSAAVLERLGEMLDPLRRDDIPFAHDVPAAERKDAVWVDPRYVGEVRFMDWTGPGRLRHPAWRGLREDKKPSEVRRES